MAMEKREYDLFRSYLILSLMTIIKLNEHSTFTYLHSDRVASITNLIGSKLELPKREIAVLWRSSILHDIGKIGINNNILLAERKLNRYEYMAVQKHSIYGEKILKPIPYLKMESLIVRQHHERFNGSGYPDRLKGKQIHLYARIIGIADVFDSLLMDRPYRKGWDFYEAVQYIKKNSGVLFDPDLVKIFTQLYKSGELVRKYNIFKEIEYDYRNWP